MKYILFLLCLTGCSAAGENNSVGKENDHIVSDAGVYDTDAAASSCDGYTFSDLIARLPCTVSQPAVIVCATGYSDELVPIDARAKWFFECIDGSYVGHYHGTQPEDPIE